MDMFKRSTGRSPVQGPASLSAAAMTGIVVAHAGENRTPPLSQAGSDIGNLASPSFQPAPPTSGHAFTIALTPVGDGFVPPKDNSGGRLPVSPATASSDITEGDTQFQFYGRHLEVPDSLLPSDRSFKVGNWLDRILDRYGIAAPSGSMLPPGSRVFLEISTNMGFGAVTEATDITGQVMSGAWVGSVKASFEVETADGTAYSTDVNVLGDSK